LNDGKDVLLSDLYTDYKNSEISDGLTTEEVRNNVTEIYNKINSSFENSFSTTSKKAKFDIDSFMSGIYGNVTSNIMARKYTAKTIDNYMNSAWNFKDELLRMSMYFYIKSQEFKGIIEYKSNMLTYANVLYPSNIVDDEFDIEEYYKNVKFIDNYNLASKLSVSSKILVREDIYFAYETTDSTGRNFLWKKLPSEYCKIIGRDRFETYRVAFNYTYFDRYPEDLDTFPIEFKSKYNSLKIKRNDNKKNSKVDNQLNKKFYNSMLHELDNTKAIAFKFDESVDYVLPFYSGMFVDLIRLAELKDVEVVGAVSDNYKLLHQLVPMNDESGKKDDFMISGGFLKGFHNNLTATSPVGVGVVTSPMPVSPITLKQGVGSAEEGIVKKQMTNLLTQSGTSSLLFNGASTSASGLENNIQVDENMMFKLLRQYEKFMRKRLFLYNKNTYKYTLSFINHTFYNTDKLYNNLSKAGQAGMNTEFELNAILGRSQLSFINSGKLLDKLGLRDEMIPFKSSHVGDGSEEPKEVGDKKIKGDLSDGGEKTKDNR